MAIDINQPTAQSERIVALDVIRGVALLGILIMNIQAFSMVLSAYSNPMSFGDLTKENFYIYYFSHLFADQKFMTIFSLLFGTGIVLMANNIAKKQGNPTKIHYKRMIILALIGLIHAYLLWYGDILFPYAISGMIVYSARNRSVRFLLILGITLITFCSLIILAAGISLPYWEPADIAKVTELWAPSADEIQQNILANQSSWLVQMSVRHTMAAEMHRNILFYISRVIGLMLIGMAFYKLDFFGDRFSNRSLIFSGAVALFAGLAIIITGNAANFASNWQMESLFIGSQYNYWGSIIVAYAYLALLVVFCRSNKWLKVKSALANVGKMALTNYLSHTFICGFIFYGWGLGLFGTVARSGQLLIVIAIWLFQLWFSSYWMKRFRFGPFEWLWRTMTYGHQQPLKRNKLELAIN